MITLLPKGSVVFEEPVVQGVVARVTSFARSPMSATPAVHSDRRGGGRGRTHAGHPEVIGELTWRQEGETEGVWCGSQIVVVVVVYVYSQ